METIKSVKTPKFEIVLTQHTNGHFSVGVEQDGKQPVIVTFEDYNTATQVFDQKLVTLEGH